MFDFNEIVFKLLVVLLVPLSTLMFIISMRNIKEELPGESREYMDPLPPMLRLIWPLARFFAYYIGERLSIEFLEKTDKTLRKSGLSYLMNPAQFIGLRITSSVVMGLVVLICMSMLETFDIVYLILGIALGYFLPSMSVRDLKKKREKALIKALPVYLDFLTMAVQAGMNMSGAIQQAVDKGIDGPLKWEFARVLRDIKAGIPRLDALRDMAERNEIKEINAFVTAIVQAEKTGASVGSTLKIQADQRRTERFQRAEKLAMEAPVKLIFPLVAFIFPMTFMILGFPIAMKFLYEM